jgi:N-acyl-D-amino-acid deacylase
MNKNRAGKVILAGGRLIDGCGNPWVRADVLIADGVVEAVGSPGALVEAAGDARVIPLEDRYVTPGFIDPHTHSDVSILTNGGAESAVRQGVTTHVIGNCGMSAAPVDEHRIDELIHHWQHYFDVSDVSWNWRSFADYLGRMEEAGVAINIVPLVGHGALRIAAMGYDERPATEDEMGVMKRHLADSMKAGAFGFSTGLVYPPGCYAPTAELIELARVAASFGGLYASHIRGERETILAAVREAIEIADEAGIPAQISHNAPKWGGPPARENLALIEGARALGRDVTLDNDTHTDLAPRLSRALPQPILDLGREELLALLAEEGRRDELRREINTDALPAPGYAGLLKHGSFERIIVYLARNEALIGRSIDEIARERGRGALDTYLDLIVEERDEIAAIFDYIDEASVREILAHPLTMVSSDGLVLPLPRAEEAAVYMPCSFGEYPGVLERFVRDRSVLRLEDAIRKMTSYPAQRFGLWDRGVLRPGAHADIVVFDLEKVRDRATNLYPHKYPFENMPPRFAEGMDFVFVNGVAVIDEGEHTNLRPGRVLRRQARIDRSRAAGSKSETRRYGVTLER